MKDFKSKQKLKHLLYSPVALLLLLGVTFILARGAWSVVAKERESAKVLASLQEENDSLTLREAELKQHISDIQTEAGLIQEIRAKFNATRAGEHLAVIVEEESQATTTASSTLEKIKAGWFKWLASWHLW